jgi:5-methylcytosine-specific restriction endonuclease McrA
LNETNFDELVTQAAGKTKRELAELLARIAPRPDVPSTIRKLPSESGELPLSACAATTDIGSSELQAKTLLRVATAAPPPQVEPLSPDRYKVQLTAGVELRDKLERARDLMRHRNPSGDLAVVVERALDLLLEKLEKERLGKTTRPRSTDAAWRKPPAATTSETAPSTTAKEPDARSHRPAIPRAVRREVFARDGEQCTFVDPAGTRCPARALLELDHVQPWSLGGSNDASNLRVTCRAHNQFFAELKLGKSVARFRRRTSRRAPAPAATPPPRILDGEAFELATRGLVGMGFAERDSRRALDLVCARHATAPAPPAIPEVLREALGVLT